MSFWSRLKHWMGVEKVDATPTGYRRISASDARELLARNPHARIVDVRLAGEYHWRHIPGSVLIPLSTLATQAPLVLPDKEAPVILHCHGGYRSYRAARQLLAMGYTQVYDLGGINRWPYETVSGEAR